MYAVRTTSRASLRCGLARLYLRGDEGVPGQDDRWQLAGALESSPVAPLWRPMAPYGPLWLVEDEEEEDFRKRSRTRRKNVPWY